MIKGEGNRKRKCKECELKIPACEGLIVGVNFVCSIKCAYKLGNKALSKTRERQKQKAKRMHEENKKKATAKHRERKKQVKRSSDHRSEAQDLFNKMRRLEELVYFASRGDEPWCISCQKPIGGDIWACGHYKTRGARKDLAFDRENTHLQHNFSCNSHKSGDVDGQKIGFVLRYGEEKAKQILERLEIVGIEPKRTWQDWEKMKSEFRKEIKNLEKELSMYN